MTGAEWVAIRPAQVGEHAAVGACVCAAYAGYVGRLGREPAPMLADYAALIARGVVWVIPGNGGFRGVLVLEPVDGAMFIENVAVAPEDQGHGFGRALLEFAEGRARAARRVAAVHQRVDDGEPVVLLQAGLRGGRAPD